MYQEKNVVALDLVLNNQTRCTEVQEAKVYENRLLKIPSYSPSNILMVILKKYSDNAKLSSFIMTEFYYA